MEMDIRKGRTWGYMAGIVSGITYGMNPLFGKPILNEGINVYNLLFHRYAIAMLILAAMMLVKGNSFRISKKQLGHLCLIGALFTVCSIALFASYNYLPSGIATTILYVYPIMVALLMLFYKEYPSWQTWVSIFAGVIGAMFLSFSGETGILNPVGLVLIFISALAYSLLVVVLNRSSEVRQLNNVTISFYNFLFGSVILAAITFGTDRFQVFPSASSWLNLAGLALIPTAIATITLSSSSKLIGATKTSILGILEPLTAIFIGCVLFREPFTLRVAIGIALILFAILFMVLSKENRHTLNRQSDC